jgi:hypothetical protein
VTIVLLALVGWVLTSYGIGALWILGHRERPEPVPCVLPEPVQVGRLAS